MQAAIDRMAAEVEMARMHWQAAGQARCQAVMHDQTAELRAQAAELKYQALMMQMKEAAHTADMARAAQDMRESKSMGQFF